MFAVDGSPRHRKYIVLRDIDAKAADVRTPWCGAAGAVYGWESPVKQSVKTWTQLLWVVSGGLWWSLVVGFWMFMVVACWLSLLLLHALGLLLARTTVGEPVSSISANND